MQFVVNSCAKENNVINFLHILYYHAVVNLVIGIFTASCACHAHRWEDLTKYCVNP